MHYHLRPGGVRRVIELALPHLASLAPAPLESVVLASGGAPDVAWRENLSQALKGTRLQLYCEPAFRYLSEQRSSSEAIRRRIRSALEKIATRIPLTETLIWAQNLGVGRNLILADELAAFSARYGVPLLSHHHDLWFENRWARWKEMRACGFRSLSAVANASFAAGARVCHVTINRLDNAVLAKHLGSRARCMPNLTERGRAPTGPRVAEARKWLRSELGDDAPVWIFPTRFLRRKNLAEAILLTRWLRPEGWFVTTAGVSSREEQHYARRLESAARRENWRVRFRLLADATRRAPAVGELAAASEVMLLSSAQEGFGLPFLEASALQKPLIARYLPNIVPDLLKLGFSFPNLYHEILIPPDLLNLDRERIRQRKLWRDWKATLPSVCRGLAERPPLFDLSNGDAVPFSRLTLSAQLEVLAIPAEESWASCAAGNPFLQKWRTLSRAGNLKATPWAPRAEAVIGGDAYAARFWRTASAIPSHPLSNHAAESAQRDSIAERLGATFLYPILFGDE